MTPIVNLYILKERFTHLSRSAYFDSAFREFSAKAVKAISHVVENPGLYSEDIVRDFEKHVWRVMQFIQGSRAKDAPHETQFALKRALSHWITGADTLVSSASLEELDFYLAPDDIWAFVSLSLNHFDTGGYRPLLVRIGSPGAYKHRPLFCIPLFHELGHFVDNHFKITELSLLLNPPGPPPAGMRTAEWDFVNLRHRMEHFADLFGATYCGASTNGSLVALAPNNPPSATHPATMRRVDVVNDFLGGVHNHLIESLQHACEMRTGKRLSQKWTAPDIGPLFDGVLTYRIRDESELFGIYLAGWNYLEHQLLNRGAPWIDKDMDAAVIESTINDLIEKSLRNFEVRERWAHDTSNK